MRIKHDLTPYNVEKAQELLFPLFEPFPFLEFILIIEYDFQNIWRPVHLLYVNIPMATSFMHVRSGFVCFSLKMK